MNIAGTMLVASLVTLPLAVSAWAQKTAGCGEGSTLKNTYSPTDTRRAEDFLVSLKKAVETNDTARVATMVQYPLHVNLPNHTHRLIRTPQQFRAQYDFLFNADTRKAVHDQVPACMFARDQGAMIGSGQIWFQDVHGTFKIWSFNHM